MFKRHQIFSCCVLVYYVWIAYVFWCRNTNDRTDSQVIFSVFFGTLFFLLRAIFAAGQDRKDYLKFWRLLYLPYAVLILLYIIYLLCRGKVISKLM